KLVCGFFTGFVAPLALPTPVASLPSELPQFTPAGQVVPITLVGISFPGHPAIAAEQAVTVSTVGPSAVTGTLLDGTITEPSLFILEPSGRPPQSTALPLWS